MKKMRLAGVKGFASLFVLGGMLLLAAALPMATKLVQQNQENRSSAASNIIQDSKCKNAGGVCKSTSASCNGSWKSGYCPSSGSNVKCCVPKKATATVVPTRKPAVPTIAQNSKCKNAGGVCQKTSKKCSGSWKTGYCSGASDVKCCVPKTSDSGSNIVQDASCTSRGGKCQKINTACNNDYGYVSGLCPSNDNTVKCCARIYDSNSDTLEVSIKQDKSCTSIGGVCQSKKGGCKAGNFVANKCNSNGSNVSCCVETNCTPSRCDCTNQEACKGIGCYWKNGKGCYKKVVTPSPSNNYHSYCVSDSDCISNGKCAMTDDTRTRVCIPRSGTVYVCDRYHDDFYSEKWVNGSQSGDGKKCSNGCNISTGKCK